MDKQSPVLRSWMLTVLALSAPLLEPAEAPSELFRVALSVEEADEPAVLDGEEPVDAVVAVSLPQALRLSASRRAEGSAIRAEVFRRMNPRWQRCPALSMGKDPRSVMWHGSRMIIPANHDLRSPLVLRRACGVIETHLAADWGRLKNLG